MEQSPYRPTPTIIEAAERLFAGHGVTDISHAFARNLHVTSTALRRAIEASQSHQSRTICFVTGIPGAGKTLTGLNAVHDPAMRQAERPAAVFLSGNGPLVKIIREALTRDRQRAGDARNEARRTVSTFIGNIHQFLVTYAIQQPNEPPYENAIVFDERSAWDASAVKKKHGISKSEPELLLEIMERSPEWSAIVAPVGGGQEIHRGEAGLEEWGDALNRRDCSWRVMASPEVLGGGHSVAGHRLFSATPSANLKLIEAPEFHLDVNVRSPRALRVGEWVNALLARQLSSSSASGSLTQAFPVVLTRGLEDARQWLRARTDGVQRCGLLTSSGALWLRAHGIEVSSSFRQGYPYEDWFLSGPEDTRSSTRLEVAATEFECQGLELDWAGICWVGTSWSPRRQAGGFAQSFAGRDGNAYGRCRNKTTLPTSIACSLHEPGGAW